MTATSTSMNGKKLMNAAKIIASAGEQIEGMIEILYDKMTDTLTDEDEKQRVDADGSYDSIHSKGKWLKTSYFWDIALYKKRKQKPYAHLAVQVMLYDEDEARIQGWEPSIYVMYAPGEDEFESDSCRLRAMLAEEARLDGDRLWRWEEFEENDSWLFAVPLVRMNHEVDLDHQIADPVRKLIAGNPLSQIFPDSSVAFQFVQEGEILRIIERN